MKTPATKKRELETSFWYSALHIVLIICLFFFGNIMISTVFSARAHAADITLKWARNTEPDIAGYKIFYGIQSQAYDNVITINDTATEPEQCEYTIYGLQEGQTYYIALKSFDLGGNESAYSEETSVLIPCDSQQQIDIPGNSITNGGMEQGNSEPLGWNLYDVAGSNGQTNEDPGEWTTEEAHTGSHSLKLHNATGSHLGWYGQEIEFDAPYPKTLAFGGWSKAYNVSSTALYCIDFKVTFEDGTYTWFYKPLRFSTGTHDWELKQVIKTWSKGVVSVRPYALMYYKSGTAWFDDIFVIANPDNYIYNGDFEIGEQFVSGWHLYEAVPQGKQANTDPGEWTTEEAHSGNHALKLHNETGSYIGWYGEKIKFAAPYPRTLTFGGWAKTLNLEHGALCTIDFKVTFQDGKHVWFYQPFKLDPGTDDWQLKKITKTFSKGVKEVKPYVLLYYKSGTAWFDDIFVQE